MQDHSFTSGEKVVKLKNPRFDAKGLDLSTFKRVNELIHRLPFEVHACL